MDHPRSDSGTDANTIVADISNGLLQLGIHCPKVSYRVGGGWFLRAFGGYLWGVAVVEYLPEEQRIVLQLRTLFRSRTIKIWEVGAVTDPGELVTPICRRVRRVYNRIYGGPGSPTE